MEQPYGDLDTPEDDEESGDDDGDDGDSDSDSGDKGCPLPKFLQKFCSKGDKKKDWTKIFADWKCSTCDKWPPVFRDKCYAKWC